jgi:murein DD-endopeptidase MepM/ murein hydrolase activator NlpD
MTVWGNGTASKPNVSASGKWGAARPNNRKHAGADFTGYGDLKAIEGGIVTLAGKFTADAGNAVAIDLPGQIDGCTVTIVRMHIADGSITVRVGDSVVAGQVIGKMGSTGNAEGDCDHVEIRFWRNGVLQKTVDPEVWIAGRMPAVASLGGVGTGGTVRTRVSKAASNGRVTPTTAAAIRGSLAAHVTGSFDGFRHAQSVEGNDVWFHGHFTGLWYWSGAFTDPSPAGLKAI